MMTLDLAVLWVCHSGSRARLLVPARTHDTPTVINMATVHLYLTTDVLCLVERPE